AERRWEAPLWIGELVAPAAGEAGLRPDHAQVIHVQIGVGKAPVTPCLQRHLAAVKGALVEHMVPPGAEQPRRSLTSPDAIGAVEVRRVPQLEQSDRVSGQPPPLASADHPLGTPPE